MLCFASCDGKHRVLDTHDDKLKRSELSETFFKRDVYVPAKYTASITDTILSSGLKIRVKYYAVSDKLVKIKNNNNSNSNTHYRQFESQIQVFKNDKLSFDDILNTSDFADQQNPVFWEKAILQYVWLDDSNSTENNIQINCSFSVPKTNEYRSYTVYFNSLGDRNIELIDAT